MKKLVLLMIMLFVPTAGFSYGPGYESDYGYVDKGGMYHAKIKKIDAACQSYCMQDGSSYGYCKYQCEYDE